jgi:sec-independent protein translocase protein TatB
MFGIGPTELIVLLVIALIVVGPERLPQMAGQIGKAIRDFRQMSGDVTGEFQRAFQLDEQPPTATQTMTNEVIGPSATPNGTPETLPTLTAQVIPDEPPIEPPVTVEASAPVDAGMIYDAPISPPYATKDEPLAGVSFLDEPEPAPAAPPATTTYEGMAVATFSPPPLPADEPVVAQDPVADAWDAVLHTDATISLPEPTADELQPVATVGTAVALAEPEEQTAAENGPAFGEPERRPRIDPAAEVTIREVIEGQVASEAFRERRRIAKYQRRK